MPHAISREAIMVRSHTDAIVGVDHRVPIAGQVNMHDLGMQAAVAATQRILPLFTVSDLPDRDGRSSRLIDALRRRGVTRVFLVGLRFPCSVGWTACDLAEAGFEVCIVHDALPDHTTLAAGNVEHEPPGVMEGRMTRHGVRSVSALQLMGHE